MCTTSSNSGICSVSIQLPSEWFSFNEYSATATIEVRIIGRDDLPLEIGTVLLYSNEEVTVTNSIAFVLPSQPINPGETFTAIAYGHATYAVATFSLLCTVSNEMEIVKVNIDNTIWLSEVRMENNSSLAVVAILKESELAVFDKLVDIEELFTIELLLKDTATSDDSTSFRCTINYLSNVLNEKIIPSKISSFPSAVVFDYNTTNSPYDGNILVSEADNAVGLISYTDQVQIMNLAYISGIEQTFSINHYLVNSHGQLEETTLVNCSTDSNAFYLSPNCLSLVLNGTEEAGANKATIIITHKGFTSTVYLRAWYPFSGAKLSVDHDTLYPVKDAFVRNSTNDCIQLWEQGNLELFVEYSFEPVSESRIVSLLSFVVDQLYVSQGPGELDASGILTPLSEGNITVSAGSNISPVVIFADESAQEIETMGITIFSNILLTLPNVTQAITVDDFRGTALLEQNFKSISSPVYIIAGAILTDGYNIIVSYENGLRLESLDESIVRVASSNDSLFLVSSGQGQLLSAQWISQCTSDVLAEGIAYGTISVPDPLEIELASSSLRITSTGDFADIAGVPTSVNITVLLKYPDDESRNVIADSLLDITIQSPDGGLVSVISTDEVLMLSLIGDQVLGTITVLADYNNGQYTKQLQITSVAYSSLSLFANPYPEYENSNEILLATLYRIYPTNKYQRAQLTFDMVLTDNTTFDITGSKLAVFSTFSTIVTPSEPGEIAIEGRFGSLSDVAILNIAVSDEVVVITSIDSTLGLDTLSGVANEATVQLLANVTFNDTTEYPNFLPDGAELFENVLSLQTSSDAIELDSMGLIRLVKNHHDLVDVTLTAALSAVTETISFACNLEPAIGDIDIGYETGVAIPSLNIGTDVIVPLRINVGNNILLKAEILLLYNNLLEVTDLSQGNDWEGTVTYIENKGAELTSLTIIGEGVSTSGVFEFAFLHVTAVSSGLAEITGIVQSLRDSNDNIIGNEGTTIIAGSLNIEIQGLLNKRSIESVLTKRESICDPGDVNGDCIFDNTDIQYLLSELSLNVLNTSYDISSSDYDIDSNSYFDPSDAYYLYRVSTTQSYLLTDLTVTPASSDTNCILELNATVVGGRNQAPQSNTTIVFFDFSLPFDLLFEQQDQLDASFFYHGSIVLSPKSVFLHGAIIQATQTGLDTYTVSMATNLTTSDIGLSLIIVTANNANIVTPGRIQTLHGSPYSPYDYKYPLDIELNAFDSTIPLIAQDGYNAFDMIDNSNALTECKFFVIARFSNANYVVSIPEDASVQSILVTVALSVGSFENSKLEITSGNTNMDLALLQNGSLILNNVLDYEKTTNYVLTVTSSENINQTMAMTMITVNVTDVNDNSPVLLPIEDVHILSNLPISSTVFTINGTDADSSLNGMLEYAIFSDEHSLFSVNENTGQVILNMMLNVTEELVYVLTVGARDFGTPKRETQLEVNITVTEYTAPTIVFAKDEYILNVTENAIDGTFVAMLLAQVLNSEEVIQVNYSIISIQSFPFVIGEETGIIEVSEPLDREDIDIYVAIIEAKAFVYPDIVTATSMITINVLDENDNSPDLTISPNNLTLSEDIVVSAELDLDVSVTDDDIGSNSIITFSLSGSLNSNQFTVNNITGQITLVKPLDYETEKELQFVIVASDNGNPSLNDSEIITITVMDINDNPPRLILNPVSLTVNRSIPLGFVLAEITVTDDDSNAVNGQVNITLQNEYFGFSSNFSQLILTKSIANVTNRRYNLSILAQDITKPILTTVTSFIVIIDDDELNTPRFIDSYFTFELKENSTKNTTIVDLNTLLHPDYIDPQSDLEFLITNENQDTFGVNANGDLFIEGVLDYETVTSYLFEVLVRYANDEDLLNSTATINITITDVNDNVPFINVTDTNITVSTTTPLNSTILEIEVIDYDSNENGEVDLVLSGNVAVWIIVDSEIRLNKTLVINETITYYLTITATDNGMPSLSSSIDVVITTNPFTIQFEQENYQTDIPEDTDKGINIFNVTAVTNLPSDITYTLVTDSQIFSIDNVTGMIYNLVLFDFEQEEYYEFRVEAMATPIESQSVRTIANVSLQLIDVNDNGPYFIKSNFEIDLKENAKINETIIDLTSIVEDDDTIISEIEFILQDNDEDIFGITADHNLYLKNGIDYENMSMYTFSVFVRDPTDPLLPTNSSFFIISITDINDNSPIITAIDTNITISSAIPIDTSVLQIIANDLDSANNSIIDLSLFGGNSFWVIMQDGNLTLTKELNIFEEVSFVITIIVTDRGMPPLSSSIIIHIIVDSVQLTFIEDSFIGNITENDPFLKELVSVSAEVSVDDTQVSYSLSNETQMEYGDKFSIDNVSGAISNLKPLDYEEEDEYLLLIEASLIINSQTITSYVNVTIEVIDVNDNPPVLTIMFNSLVVALDENDIYNLTTEEESIVNISVIINDQDSPDNSIITFESILGPDSEFFSLDTPAENNINVISNTPLDREIQSVYNLSIRVTNEGHLSTLITTGTFLITLTDVNDNSPIFSEASYSVLLVTPLNVGTVIIDLLATDDDTGINGLVQYSLTDDNELFEINESTGVLKTTEDILSKDFFIVNILATDSSTDLPLSTSAVVNITLSDLIDGRENDAMLIPDPGLGIIGLLAAINSTSYSTKFGFALPNILSERQNITANLGTVSSSGYVETALQQPTTVNCILVNDQIWEDDRTLYLAAQVLNDRNHVQTLPAFVFVQIEHASEGIINTTTTVETSTGNTVVTIDIPLTWFTNAAIISVACGLNSENLQDVGQVSLSKRSEVLLDVNSYVYMELPLSPQLPGDVFQIPIYAESGDIAVGTYALQINCSDQFEIQNISVDSTVWIMASRAISNNSDIVFTGLLADLFMIPTPGKILLANITALSNTDQPEDDAFSLTVHFLGTADKEKILPPPGIDTISGNASTYKGLQERGAVNATNNGAVGLFLHTITTDILNTAVLSGEDISLPVMILSVLRSGEIVETTDSFTCLVSHPGSFEVSKDCTTILITNLHTEPVKNATLTVESNDGVTGTLTLSVWTPVLPGSVQALDSTLNSVSQWVINPNNDGCTQQYQRTRVIVSTNFTDSENVIENVIITHLVTLTVNDLSVLTVSNEDGVVTGISPGTSLVMARSKDGSKTVGDIEITVSSSDVEVQGLDVQVITSISLLPINISVNSFEEHEIVVSTKQELDIVGSQGTIVVTALYSDGQRNIINLSEGLRLSSLADDIVEIVDNTVSVIGNGSGVLINAEWTAVLCGDQNISSGLGYVNVALLDPVQLNVSLEAVVLAPANSIANQIGVPASALVTHATIEFENGEVQDILNNVNTQFSLLQPNNEIIINTTDGISVRATENAELGVHTVLVNTSDYNGLGNTINVTVVEVIDLNVSARPYPLYEGSDIVVVNELRQIASSGLYQQALLEVNAILSNEEFRDVNNNSDVLITLSSIDDGIEADIISTDDGFVINVTKVDNSGTMSVTASLFSISSSVQYSLSISSDSVNIATISVQTLPNDTFSGVVGTNRQITPTVTLTDGSVYTNLFQDIVLPNVVRFEQSLEQNAFTVNENTGIATLLANSHVPVTVTVVAIGDSTVSASVQFYCNLEPAVGDIDFGDTVSGPSIATQKVEEYFTVPLSVNSVNSSLDFIEISLSFDSSIIEAVEVTKTSQWPSTGVFGYTVGDPRGALFIAGTFGPLSSVVGSLIHIADITLIGISEGRSHLNGTILNLSDKNGLIVGNNVPKNIIAGDVEIVIEDVPLVKRSSREKREMVCESSPEAGDVDGDCVFDVRDVAYLQSYYLDILIKPNDTQNVSDEVQMYLDGDRNGFVDPNDALFMSRVAFNYYRFVDDFQVSAVMEEKCFLNITISSIGIDNVPAQPESTQFLAHFTHSHSDFNSQFNRTNFTVGTILEAIDDNDVDIVLAEYINNGSYRITADASLLLDEVGVSLIQVTFNDHGVTTESRVAIFTQDVHFSGSYPAFNFTVIVMDNLVNIHRQLPYSPLLLFNNSLTTDDCFALMTPVMFNQTMYTINVSEDTPLIADVLQVGATVGHPDAFITFSIDNSSIMKYDSFPFAIDEFSGIISTIGELDYENISNFTFIVFANENRTLTNASTVVEIIVTNINDLLPVFEQTVNTTITVPASAEGGFFVLQLNATDPDLLDNIFFSITSSTIEDVFIIDNSTGIITVNNDDLFVLNNTDFLLQITAADTQFNVSTSLNIFIYLPFFSQNTYQAQIPEDTAVNTTITNISLLNSFSEIFSFSLFPDYEFFSVNSEGTITVSTMLDFESENGDSYNMTISAISDNFYLNSSLAVIVSDVNDNSPIFSTNMYNIVLPNYLPLGTVLDIVNVTDADSPPHSILQYSLQVSTDSQFFSINDNGDLAIVNSLLNSQKDILIVRVIVNDSVHSVNTSITIQLEFQELGLPIVSSFITDKSTFVLGSSVVSKDLSNVQISQMFALLPNTQRTVFISMGDQLTTPIYLDTPLNDPKQLTVHLLHYDTVIYSHQNDLVLIAQVKDNNNFMSTMQDNVFVNFTHSNGTLTSSCTSDVMYGRCFLYITLPLEWFESKSVVNWTVTLQNQPDIIVESSVQLMENSFLTQQMNNSITVLLPSGNFLPGDYIRADVYGMTHNAIAGFSLLFNLISNIEFNDILFNDTQWSISSESNGDNHGILGVVSSPSSEAIHTNDRTLLFTLELQVSLDLDGDEDKYISGTVISLSDVIEGTVIINDETDSRSGPVYFVNETSISELGLVSTITERITSILLYVDQPVLFNTAVLSGITIEVPIEIWAGYTSGNLSLYTGIVEFCESSDSENLKISDNCKSLVLTSNELTSNGDVNITLSIDGIIGILTVTVYYPIMPIIIGSSDSVLQTVELSITENCESNYQRASLKAYIDFATDDLLIPNVDITDLIIPYTTSSNQTVAVIDDNGVITGIDPGLSNVCANTFDGNNPSCINISVTDSTSVFVIGLGIAIHQGVENIVFEAVDNDFIYNITIELDSKIQNVSQIIISLQYTDNEMQSMPTNEFSYQTDDPEIVAVNSEGEVFALKNGKTNLSVTWIGPGNNCEFQVTKVMPIEVILLTPTTITVSPSQSVVHRLTSNVDPSAVLNIQTSFEIVLLLEYPNGVVLQPDELIYNISDDDLAEMNGNIIQGLTGTGFVNLTIDIPNIQTDGPIIIQFNIVSTVTATITATPYPAFTNSETIDIVEISRIEGTLYWQRSKLGLQITLSDGFVIEATEQLEDNLFASSSNSPTLAVATDNNILIVNPLNGTDSSGTVIVTPIIPQFSGIHKAIIVVGTSVPVSGASVSHLSDDTLIGHHGKPSHRINVSIELEDNSSISDILSVSDEFINIITLTETNESFEISSDGSYLIPLMNAAEKQPLMVTVASKFIQEITFYVNLRADVGDIDIGQETGPPLGTVETGDDIVVPVYLNTGNNSLGYIELSFIYDSTVLTVSDVTLGSDWANGMYHFNTENEGSVLFTSIFPETNIKGEQLHLFNIILTGLSQVSETVLNTEVLVIGYHDYLSEMSSPYDNIASYVTVSVTGNGKRAVGTEIFVRDKREMIDSSGCISPPCDCENVIRGDVNNDCLFDSADILQLLSYLKLDNLNISILANTSSTVSSEYDVTLDQAVDVHDVYVIFKALIGYIPLIDEVAITPVQSPLSNCQLTVKIVLSENVQSNIVYVLVNTETQETEFELTEIINGDLITYHENQNGGLVRAIKQSNDLNEYIVTLNTPIIGDFGISIIAQSFDPNNQTNSVRTVQYFGPPPSLYKSELLINTGLLFIFSSNGYSPLVLSNNEIMSSECSNIPLINDELVDIIFHSPNNATVVWELDNLRQGLNLSMFIFVNVTKCALNQNSETVLSTCQDIDPIQAVTNNTALLMTQPFTLYTVTVVGPTTSSNETTEISPEDGKSCMLFIKTTTISYLLCCSS